MSTELPLDYESKTRLGGSFLTPNEHATFSHCKRIRIFRVHNVSEFEFSGWISESNILLCTNTTYFQDRGFLRELFVM